MTDKIGGKYVKYTYRYNDKTFTSDTIKVTNKRVYDGDEVYDYRIENREYTLMQSVLAKTLENPTIACEAWGIIGYGPSTFTEEDFLKMCLCHFRQRDKHYMFEHVKTCEAIYIFEKRLGRMDGELSDKMVGRILMKTILDAGNDRVRLSSDATYLEASMFEGEVVIWAYFDEVVSVFVKDKDKLRNPADIEDIQMAIDSEAIDSTSMYKCGNDRAKFHKVVNLTRKVYKIETD